MLHAQNRMGRTLITRVVRNTKHMFHRFQSTRKSHFFCNTTNLTMKDMKPGFVQFRKWLTENFDKNVRFGLLIVCASPCDSDPHTHSHTCVGRQKKTNKNLAEKGGKTINSWRCTCDKNYECRVQWNQNAWRVKIRNEKWIVRLLFVCVFLLYWMANGDIYRFQSANIFTVHFLLPIHVTIEPKRVHANIV